MNCQKYYLICPDPSFTDQPEIINVAQKLPLQSIYKNESWKIESRPLLKIKSNPYVFFADYMENPVVMITKKTKDILKRFDSSFLYKEIILYDPENQLHEIYVIPFFKKVNCLSEQSHCNVNRSVIYDLVLKKDLINGLPFFYIDQMDLNFLVMRLDVVEQLLRAGVTGFTLSHVKWEARK